jgi:hypothetical protein
LGPSEAKFIVALAKSNFTPETAWQISKNHLPEWRGD